MRSLSLVTALALVLSACGGTGSDSAETADSSSTTAAVSTTAAPTTGDGSAPGSSEAPDDSTSTPSEAPEAASFDGPPAPDFELVLNDGEAFTLSGEQKPVYMVFWAEW